MLSAMRTKVEISRAVALMPNASGKILVHKLWGVGYLIFNANKHS